MSFDIKRAGKINACIHERWLLCYSKIRQGRGGGSAYGGPSSLQQMMHLCMTRLTNCLPLMIQYFDLSSVKVSFTPLCITLSWASCTIITAKWCDLMSNIGCFALYGASELPSLPPHLQTSPSRKRLDCLFHVGKPLCFNNSFCNSFTQMISALATSLTVSSVATISEALALLQNHDMP